MVELEYDEALFKFMKQSLNISCLPDEIFDGLGTLEHAAGGTVYVVKSTLCVTRNEFKRAMNIALRRRGHHCDYRIHRTTHGGMPMWQASFRWTASSILVMSLSEGK